MGWFSRKKPKVVVPLDQRGPFHAVWGKRKQPSPGVMNYAYETLALMPQSPINGAVAVRGQIHAHQPEQPYIGLAIPVQGVPLVAGQVYGQPLYDPNAGYVDPMGTNNVPYRKPAPGTAFGPGELY